MSERPLRLLILGAHPDDADFGAGGLAAKYRRLGHDVRMVSVTDGSAGHQRLRGSELAEIRAAEARAAGQVIGAEYVVWDFPDGQLQPTLQVRERIITEIRRYSPDLLVTHRAFDYHPDHRAVGQAVMDACYLVTVPAIVPDVPALRRNPVVALMHDGFNKPVPFEPHVLIDIDDVFDQVVAMLGCHFSQFFEWLPYNGRIEAEVPEGEAERRVWLARQVHARLHSTAERYRNEALKTYGSERGSQIDHLEVFEISEYGSSLEPSERHRLFPFVPWAVRVG